MSEELPHIFAADILITDVNGFVLRCDKYAKALNKKYDRLTQKLESLQDKKALDEFISSEKIKVPDELLQDIKKADTNMAKEMLDFILQVDFDNALRKIFEKIPKHKFYMAYALVFSGIGALIAAPVAYFLNDKD